MYEIDYTWTSTGSSGGLDPLQVRFPAVYSVLYVECSSLAATNSFAFQTAQQSSGPWFTEASTAISSGAAAQYALRLTGPFRYMRPYLNSASTGQYNLRLIAVR